MQKSKYNVNSKEVINSKLGQFTTVITDFVKLNGSKYKPKIKYDRSWSREMFEIQTEHGVFMGKLEVDWQEFLNKNVKVSNVF